MKAKTKKWLLAGATGIVTGTGELLVQLTNARDPVDFKRSLVLGLFSVLVVRGLGAVLAAIATTPTEPDDAKVQ